MECEKNAPTEMKHTQHRHILSHLSLLQQWKNYENLSHQIYNTSQHTYIYNDSTWFISGRKFPVQSARGFVCVRSKRELCVLMSYVVYGWVSCYCSQYSQAKQKDKRKEKTKPVLIKMAKNQL